MSRFAPVRPMISVCSHSDSHRSRAIPAQLAAGIVA